ncbi:prepilin peptidase [Proteinivorax tanatarense]|uniref:Prepilin peptidase n=1 Tax=Proteinivorax tanatarense TaxID=1260629 RepID=A0AAU7VK06_9FIRM
MQNVMVFVTAVLGFVLGFYISSAVKKIILWKQGKNNKTYTLYRSEKNSDKWINAILLSIGFLLAFSFLDLYAAILTAVMSALALFGVRTDERIRIIPNELVLLLLITGLLNQLIINGFKGVGAGILALAIVTMIFFISARLTKLMSGSLGVGAGDIKLVMALSLMVGLDKIVLFVVGIAAFLLVYILYGLFTYKIKVGSRFPMCTQIMGGFMIVMYQPVLIEIVNFIS